ncbi:MAG: glycosyltransferase [Phocaeicola sp.]
MRKKRLLFLISRFLDGGIDSVLTEYLQALSFDGKYEVTLCIGIHLKGLEVFLDRVPKSIRIVYLVNHPLLTYHKRKKITARIPFYGKITDELALNPIRRYLYHHRLNKLLKQHDAVIDFDCCFSAFLQKTDIEKITFFHFSIDSLFAQNSSRMNRIAKRLNQYDKIVTISQQMCEEASLHFPDIASKIHFIYNAINAKALELKAAVEEASPLIQEPYLLAVERLEESQKDITTLLKAYKIVKERYNRTEKLYIIGKGSSQDSLEQLVVELGLKDSVYFLGFFSNPYPWIKRAKLMVHSAKFEGLPTVLIEALLLQKIIVATDCPTGPKEILDQGRAGVLVPMGNAERMASAIVEVLSDESLQQHYLKHIEEHAPTFTFARTKPLFEALLER